MTVRYSSLRLFLALRSDVMIELVLLTLSFGSNLLFVLVDISWIFFFYFRCVNITKVIEKAIEKQKPKE